MKLTAIGFATALLIILAWPRPQPITVTVTVINTNHVQSVSIGGLDKLTPRKK